MRLPQRSSKAFTLIELIVVIVILGILALIAIPTFGKVVKKSQDESTKSTLRSIARDAQALRALDQTSTWGTSPQDAIGETNTAAGVGVLAATLTATADTGVDPKVGEVTYLTPGGEGLVLAMRSASNQICMVGASYTATTAARCVAPSTTAGKSAASAAVLSDSTLLPAGAVPTPTVAPSQPSTPTATLSGTTINVSWTAPSGSPSGYRLNQVTDEGVNTKVYEGPNTTFTTQLGTMSSACYYFTAYNSAGESKASATSCVNHPNQPLNQSYSFGPNTGQGNVTWTMLSVANVNYYALESRDSATKTWSVRNTYWGTTTRSGAFTSTPFTWDKLRIVAILNDGTRINGYAS